MYHVLTFQKSRGGGGKSSPGGGGGKCPPLPLNEPLTIMQYYSATSDIIVTGCSQADLKSI